MTGEYYCSDAGVANNDFSYASIVVVVVAVVFAVVASYKVPHALHPLSP